MKQTVSKWEKAIRVCVLFQEESVYLRVRAVIAAPRPAHSAQRCTQKKAEKLSSRRCRDMPRPGTGNTQQSLFSPHRSVSSSPSPSLAHFASFPSSFLFFVSTHFSHPTLLFLFPLYLLVLFSFSLFFPL